MGATHFEGIELDIGIAVGETLNHCLYNLFGTICIAAYAVADLDDSSPVFGRQVLVGGLG